MYVMKCTVISHVSSTKIKIIIIIIKIIIISHWLNHIFIAHHCVANVILKCLVSCAGINFVTHRNVLTIISNITIWLK